MTGCDTHSDAVRDLAAGTLSGAALEEVLEHLQTCRACSAELDLLSDLINVLHDEAPVVQPKVSEPTVDTPRQRPWAAAIVSLAIVVAALLVWKAPGPNPRELADQSLPVYVPSTLRTGDRGQSFDAAMAEYQNGNHEAAYRDLSAFLDTRPDHGPALLYRSASAQSLGNRDQARADLLQLLDSPFPALVAHARLRLASLALLQSDVEAARGHLQEVLASVPEGQYAEQAQDLLRRIEELR